ncbi:putative CoA-binding protein [Rhodoblastus acidophilus]|uniref:CoA-binding protein n=1 Tax=Rhodoblastus acidophilus TaxID=1074 RepID=UPI0022247B32|nr:CoA-binding protein [Rhodoblastus acidophilus]MCW2317392.1 putative CoA-binding protein [Rhodoblastus acidophilus]
MTDEIGAILREVKTIALVGASARPDRPSHEVMAFLQSRGYRVIPVNPGLAGQTLLGERVFASLGEIDAPIDMVDVFRRPETVAPIAEDAIAVGARVLWLQLGVVNEDAAARARAAGLKVVMDRCPKIEWLRRNG